VALVNQALARRYWPHASAVGKHVLLGRMTQATEIVGVLGDVRNINLATDPQPEIALPFAQLPWASMKLIVRTAGDPLGLATAVRARVLAIDRDQPVTSVQSMEQVLEAGAGQTRLTMYLLSAFSLCAVLLGAVGIYGAITYSVAERTAELGIRMALGAGRRDILRMVLGQGMALAGAGVLIGLAISLAAMRVIASLLYRVGAGDPATLASSALFFTAVALAASYLPARRAMQVDPVEALRQ
jgi:putative ABC transport system permease protein